ncbi:tetratricopeptide repeat protein [Kitasatospora sp. NPDC048298]|uniref:tetratricopeptide repeat protein n=1 Tax=Kitasatospora sp. NPDC048298 TaxID=3364049 RepID=UPI0037178FD3
MSGEPSIDWQPQYRGDLTRPEVLVCFEQVINEPDGAKLTALREMVLAVDPLPGDLHALASVYLLTGQFAEAVPLLEVVADMGPEDPAVRCDLASAYVLIGSVDRAARELERILAVHPGCVPAESQLAEARAWLEWHEAGVGFLRQQVGLLSGLAADATAGPTEHLALARVLYQLAAVPRSGVDWPDVVSVLERAHHLDRGHEQVLELLVAAAHNAGVEGPWRSALLELERVAPGSEHLDHWRSAPPAVEPNPDRLLAVATDPEEVHGAVRELRALYRRSPNNLDALRCVVQAEVGLGNVAEALWLAESLAAVEGLDFYGHGALAMVYGLIGDDRMRHHIVMAMELAPEEEERAYFQDQLDGLNEG